MVQGKLSVNELVTLRPYPGRSIQLRVMIGKTVPPTDEQAETMPKVKDLLRTTVLNQSLTTRPKPTQMAGAGNRCGKRNPATYRLSTQYNHHE